MKYYLYTGALGTGQTKASGRGIFKLNDRNGMPVRESGTVVTWLRVASIRRRRRGCTRASARPLPRTC